MRAVRTRVKSFSPKTEEAAAAVGAEVAKARFGWEKTIKSTLPTSYRQSVSDALLQLSS